MIYLSTATEPLSEEIEEVVTWWGDLVAWLSRPELWSMLLLAAIRIIAIIVITRILIKIVYKVIDRSLERQQHGRLNVNPRRIVTVGELLKNVTTVVCNFIMILVILGEFNFELAPLLAGAGVLGLAIGFGAQNLVKDVITGFFIILEDQFAVGDVIETGAFKGTVEVIGLRTTKILGETGEVFIVPNGSIAAVTNYSLANSMAIVDVPVKNDQPLKDTMVFIQDAFEGIEDQYDYLLDTPNILGIQSLSTSEYVIRIVADCSPNTKLEAERIIKLKLKQTMDEMQSQNAAG